MIKYDKYKNSGIEWIGEIPEHWEDKKFKFVYQFSMGATILKTDLKDNGKIPVYSATESDTIFGYVDETNVILEENDFVIPARGNSIGHIYLVKQKSTCTQTTIYAKDKKLVSSIPKYIFYYQKGLREHLFQFDRTAIPQITVDQVKANSLLIPPKSEQTAIANFLDRKTAEIDSLISRKEKLLKLYDEEKTAIINQAVTKGIISKDKARLVSFKDSGVEWLGEIPEHWEVIKLRYLVSIISGYSPEQCQPSIAGKVEYIKVDNIDKKNFKINTSSFYTKEDFVVTNSSTLLFPKRGAAIGLNKVGIVDRPVCFDTNLMGIKIQYDRISIEYLAHLIKNFSLISIADTSTIPQINNKHINPFQIPYPTLVEQKQIVHHIETETTRINSKITKTEKLIKLLKEYKTALISEVVTGKIDVREEIPNG